VKPNPIHLSHFAHREFDSPDAPGSGVQMSGQFLRMLDEARDRAGIPFVITSGYRTVAHNAQVGGVADSAHIRGLAADIAYSRPRTLGVILRAVYAVGFQRVGLGPDFVHVDIDSGKPRGIWDYVDQRHIA